MWVLIFLGALAGGAVLMLVRHATVVAEPDQWLLVVRNGKLRRAGVGIYAWRWPGDKVALFSTTLQRVRFDLDARTREGLMVRLSGFVLWSVSDDTSDALIALRKLGISHVVDSHQGEQKHVLNTPQYRAFRQLLIAAVQQHTATTPLRQLLTDQDDYLTELKGQLQPLIRSMGLQLDDLKLLGIQPANEELFSNLSVSIEEELRERAVITRLETSERLRQREIESETSVSSQEARAETERTITRDRASFELLQQCTLLEELRLEQNKRQIELEKERRLLEFERDMDLERFREHLELRNKLQQERELEKLDYLVREREEQVFRTKLARMRHKAEARRDALLSAAQVDEQKSEAVRQFELEKQLIEQTCHAFAKLPLSNASWHTFSSDSPVAGLVGLLESFRGYSGARSAGK